MQQKLYLLINKLVETSGGVSVACTNLIPMMWFKQQKKLLNARFKYSSQAWGSVVWFFSMSDCAVSGFFSFLMSHVVILFTAEVVRQDNPTLKV